MDEFAYYFKNAIQECAAQNEWKIADLNDRRAILNFSMDSGRTQILYIIRYGLTLEFSVPSLVSFDSEADISHQLSTFLIAQNSQNKFGFWCLEPIGEKLVYSYMQNIEMQLLNSDYFGEIVRALIRGCDNFESFIIKYVEQLRSQQVEPYQIIEPSESNKSKPAVPIQVTVSPSFYIRPKNEVVVPISNEIVVNFNNVEDLSELARELKKLIAKLDRIEEITEEIKIDIKAILEKSIIEAKKSEPNIDVINNYLKKAKEMVENFVGLVTVVDILDAAIDSLKRIIKKN